MTTPVLESERILLRPLKVSDAQAIYTNWTSDPDVAQFMRWSTHSSINETITWLTSEEAKVSDSGLYDWLFVLKETGEPFGSGGVFHNNTHNMFELGYCIMKKYWGNGLTTEAARTILNFAECKLAQNTFFACHAKDNPASGRILEKLGFTYKNDGQYSKFDNSRTYETREYFLRSRPT